DEPQRCTACRGHIARGDEGLERLAVGPIGEVTQRRGVLAQRLHHRRALEKIGDPAHFAGTRSRNVPSAATHSDRMKTNPLLCPPPSSRNCLGSFAAEKSFSPCEYGMISSSRLCAMSTGAP